MGLFDIFKKKDGDSHYLSAKEIREIARANSKVMMALEKRKHRK